MELKLYHFMPDKLNLYGDIGNVISLKKRCEWRGIDLKIENISSEFFEKVFLKSLYIF